MQDSKVHIVECLKCRKEQTNTLGDGGGSGSGSVHSGFVPVYKNVEHVSTLKGLIFKKLQ